MSTSRLTGTRALLVCSALALVGIGILFIHSAKALPGESFPGRAARGQIARAVVGLVLFVLVARWDYRSFARFAYPVYGLMVLLLVLLLALKSETALTARWVDLGIVDVQPSELMKVAVVLALARYLRFREDQRHLCGLVVPYAIAFVPMTLVALQPDLGTSLMLPPVLISLLYVARARLWPLLSTLAAGAASVPAAFFLRDLVPVLHAYQLRRITGFFEGDGYHYRQSMISLGSGGLTGRGWMHGSQNTLDFLPKRENDFIFSVIGEEWGFVGGMVVIVLQVAIVVLCLRVAIRTREPFGRLVATGVGVLFAAQSFQNLAMTMGLTPITGLPLPFVSHGGSSLASSFVALGLVASIALRQIRVVASRDLDPRDGPRVVQVVDSRPAGAPGSFG